MKDKMILSCLLSSFFYSIAFPTVNKVLITNITDDYIAFNAIIICAFTIAIGKLWKTKSDILFKHYGLFQLVETILYMVLILGVVSKVFDYRFYYIAETFIFAIVTKNLIFGGNKLKAIRYDKEERNKFDDNMQLATNTASLAGFVLNIVLNMSLEITFVLILIGLTIDNLFYYLAYRETVISTKA